MSKKYWQLIDWIGTRGEYTLQVSKRGTHEQMDGKPWNWQLVRNNHCVGFGWEKSKSDAFNKADNIINNTEHEAANA